MVSVDPGGTYGAEISLAVTGRGRVISTTGTSIDCPSRCYGRLVVDDKTATGAPQSVKLKAIPTPGTRFLGWSFESQQLGTRGRGSDRCNPVTRPTITPSVDTSAAEITLPFGEVEGAPPAANAGECAPTYTVPLAYRVVAKFESEATIADSGSDAGTGGEVFAQPPQVGAVAKDIGIAQSSYLYWRWDGAGISGVSTSSTFGTPSPQTVQSSTSTITLFDVEQYGAVWQRADGTLSFVTGGSTSPTSLSGAPTCVALAIDSSGVSCRTAGPAGQIVSWTLGGTGPTTQFTNVPTGYDLASDTSYYYWSNDPGSFGAGSTSYATRPGPGDGGTFNPIASGRTMPQKLLTNGSRLLWLETNGAQATAYANSSRFSATAYAAVGPLAGLVYIAPDVSSSYVWAATTSAIYRGIYTGSQTQAFRTGLVGVGGIAVDSSYVYWTQSDGRVYRASRSGF